MRISDWSSDVCSSDLSLPCLGLADRLLAVRGHCGHWLLCPYPSQRFSDLHGGQGEDRERGQRGLWSDRGLQALSEGSLHRDGPAFRGKYSLLYGGDFLDTLS